MYLNIDACSKYGVISAQETQPFFLFSRNSALDLSFPLQLSHYSMNKWQASHMLQRLILAHFLPTSINQRCYTDAKAGSQTNPLSQVRLPSKTHKNMVHYF